MPRKEIDTIPEKCPVETAINIVGGKWKLLIISLLRMRIHRFGELKKKMPRINERTLARQLRDLERDGIVSRKIYPEIPPRVEYALTENGKGMIPILDALGKWAQSSPMWVGWDRMLPRKRRSIHWTCMFEQGEKIFSSGLGNFR